MKKNYSLYQMIALAVAFIGIGVMVAACFGYYGPALHTKLNPFETLGAELYSSVEDTIRIHPAGENVPAEVLGLSNTTLALVAGAFIAAVGFALTGKVSLSASMFSVAAAVVFQVVNGTFGKMNYNYYNPIIVWLLLGSLAVVAILMCCRLRGLASFVATATPGVALCLFFALGKHPPYWHVVDVFMKIDEPMGFDPHFVLFCALLLVAFIVGEIAIFVPKSRRVKE